MSERLYVTADSQSDWYRNVVSLRRSVDLLARFVDDAEELRLVLEHEAATKPARGMPPIVVRPFEEAEVYDPIAAAIRWPFEHPCRSRYSDGSFGVWYGARELETSVYETVHHFRINTLASEAARASPGPIYQDRRVHRVYCAAMLVDLRGRCAVEPRLLDPVDYSVCQSLGRQLHAAAQPGVLALSARRSGHDIVGVFDARSLSDPRTVCYLTYALDPETGRVAVSRAPGKVEWVL